MWNYLKQNPILTAILAVCLAVIVIAAIILTAKAAKRKKTGSAFSPPAENPTAVHNKTTTKTASEPITERKNENDAVSAEETPSDLKIIEKEPSETPPQENQTQPPLPESEQQTSSAPVSEPAEKVASIQNKPGRTEAEKNNPKNKTKFKAKKNKSKEGVMNLEDLKNAPIEDENDFYDEEDEADSIARYSGKWIICRLVTANSKSAEVIHAEENDEEMFFFELRASNGEKLLTSEEYTTYNGALNGIETHKANIARGNFKITLSKKGDYLFKLLSGKNMLLCMGEHYATKARCESAIESTKRFAKTAIVDENVQDIVITPPPETDDSEPVYPDNGYNGKWIIRTHTAADGEQVFYFELFASNGEKLLSSEEYTTYVGAINGIGTHKTNIERGNFRISFTKRGDYIYKLLNGNGQLLCLGEHYKTKRRCENAIESVKRFAKNAPILSDSETVSKNA